ncbi:cell adhesion molecule 4-like isoform X2 [Littorina saxatilis]|uniref:Ig-like domain-containing protein n=2 Tax=Littorina saxatilis TaxID=31220 RepID=A0AAN9BIB4_9CAEN
MLKYFASPHLLCRKVHAIMANSAVCLLVVSLLLLFASCQNAASDGEIAAKNGDDVDFSWPLPDSLKNTLLLLSFNNASTIVFLATTTEPNSTLVVTPRYVGRINVSDSLGQGLVQFTLDDVSSRDAGHYVCMRGPKEEDVVEDCGKTLVIIDTPRNATVAPVGPLLTGSDVKLRCAASSLSLPRDHNQPMRYRWFEALPNHGRNSSFLWRELMPKEKERSIDLDDPSLGNGNDSGSGETEPEPEAMTGGDFGSLNNVVELASLDRSDDGRVFACSTSEGLDLWSTKSLPFVLRPEWKPTPSDMTFTPAISSVTLTSGGTTEVTCVANCRPLCSVVWQKVSSDDRAVTLTETDTLSLVKVGRQQQGTYRCVASNPHGNTFMTLSLTVADPPVPWFSSTTHVIIVVVVATVILALGMTGVTLVIIKCRRRTTPIVWPGFTRNSDAVPLSPLDTRPSPVSYC